MSFGCNPFSGPGAVVEFTIFLWLSLADLDICPSDLLNVISVVSVVWTWY